MKQHKSDSDFFNSSNKLDDQFLAAIIIKQQSGLRAWRKAEPALLPGVRVE